MIGLVVVVSSTPVNDIPLVSINKRHPCIAQSNPKFCQKARDSPEATLLPHTDSTRQRPLWCQPPANPPTPPPPRTAKKKPCRLPTRCPKMQADARTSRATAKSGLANASPQQHRNKSWENPNPARKKAKSEHHQATLLGVSAALAALFFFLFFRRERPLPPSSTPILPEAFFPRPPSFCFLPPAPSSF